MIRSVLGKAVSRGSAILSSLDEQLNDEISTDESVEGATLRPVLISEEEEVKLESYESCESLRGKVAKLRCMVVALEHSLEEERATSKETSEKLSLALTESSTIDSLVDEYGKLSREAARQADEDAQQIAELLVRDEEQRAKLQIFEAQIMSLTEADDTKVSDLVASGAVAVDSARLFAAVRAAKARNFELELELVDARKKVHTGGYALGPRGGMSGIANDTELHPLLQNSEHQLQGALAAVAGAEARADNAQVALTVATTRLEEMEGRAQSLASVKVNCTSLSALAQSMDSHRAADAAFAAAKARLETLEALVTATSADEAQRIDSAIALAVEAARLANKYESESRIAAAESETRIAQDKVERERHMRRALHNRVMELQGNIRVLCRCRPSRGDLDASITAAKFPEDGVIRITRPDHEGDDYDFEFDGVFSPSASQTTVFESVRDLVTSALDGYSVCIFAYGQTGSGKTHTMEGSPDDRGVNFRAIEAIINTAKTHSNGLVYDLELSMLEIYNEAIRDLLRKPGSESPRLDVTTATGVSIVKGLDIKKVSTMEEIEVWIARGASHRAAGAHALNKDSSRSHSIVTLYIKGTMPSGDILRSKLNLVDLAGSERLDKTGATGPQNCQIWLTKPRVAGDRLTEAKAINKSLSALGDVIAALSSEKKVHVPFRNSKLTYLLQDSLAGDSKALMIVTASPEIANANETICSLKFASRCHDCALGVARKNVGRKPLLSKFRP